MENDNDSHVCGSSFGCFSDLMFIIEAPRNHCSGFSIHEIDHDIQGKQNICRKYYFGDNVRTYSQFEVAVFMSALFESRPTTT